MASSLQVVNKTCIFYQLENWFSLNSNKKNFVGFVDIETFRSSIFSCFMVLIRDKDCELRRCVVSTVSNVCRWFWFEPVSKLESLEVVLTLNSIFFVRSPMSREKSLPQNFLFLKMIFVADPNYLQQVLNEYNLALCDKTLMVYFQAMIF